MRFAPLLISCVTFALWTLPASGAEIIQLTAENYDELCPQGKEVDAIYGDYLIRNDQIVAVIAQPTAWRNANMTVRNVAAAVIDLTFREEQNDQLSAFYPDARQFKYEKWVNVPAIQQGDEVSLTFHSAATAERPDAKLTYSLKDGQRWLDVTSEYENTSDKALSVSLRDEVRADNTFEKVPSGPCAVWWADDNHWRQAYGILAKDFEMASDNNNRASQISYRRGASDTVEFKPGEELKLERVIAPGAHRGDSLALPNRLSGTKRLAYLVARVSDDAGKPVSDAWVRVGDAGPNQIVARTDTGGSAYFPLDDGKYAVSVGAVGHGAPVTAQAEVTKTRDCFFRLPAPSRVQAKITDADGNPIACKVEFIGRDGTESPNFGHDSEVYAVRNLRYTPDGTFDQKINPGQYDVIVSHGIEYDAYFGQITVEAGQTAVLEAKLPRSVDTNGWVSADFHSHASPSGDNTSSQLGRVLNLLAEHIEYAPCTEHNRIDTYLPHFETLQVNGRMATASGMELTGSPLPLNHQNAFPLVMKKGEQDQGAPQTDNDPVAQVSRLALWDARSEKLVQQNHPDLGWLYDDADGNFVADEGFRGMIQFQDVVEIHMTHRLLKMEPYFESGDRVDNNVAFNWLQFLNQGIRTPAVHNTDAHYNFHGSGGIRNYVRSKTDNPAEIQTIDIVHESEAGHITLTNGPFLEVSAKAGDNDAIPGDDLAAPDGEVTLDGRVQCPNWLDIDRVQVLVNGRVVEDYNFTRAKTPDVFHDGVVKFEHAFPIKLEKDAHLIVVAVHETRKVGPVMGPNWGNELIGACANPIFVDVDGGGFQPSGDTLDHPLPVKGGRPR